MFEVSCKLGTCLQVTLPGGQAIGSTNSKVVLTSLLGPIFVAKAVGLGTCEVKLFVNGALLDWCKVTVTA